MSADQKEPTQTEIDAMLFRCRRPGILLNKTLRPDDPGLPGCWLGGRPTLPPEIEWPFDKSSKLPMQFVAQIDLAQIPRVMAYPEMPLSGTLLFFYEPVLCEFANHGTLGHRAIYVDADVSQHALREPPPMPDIAHQYAEYNEKAPREYKRWHFDLLFYESFSTHENLPYDVWVRMVRVRRTNEKALKLETEDRRVGSTAEFKMHSIFGASRTPEPAENMVRLFAFQDDHKVGIDSHFAMHAFWISPEDLAERNFEMTTFVGEN